MPTNHIGPSYMDGFHAGKQQALNEIKSTHYTESEVLQLLLAVKETDENVFTWFNENKKKP